MNHPRSVPFGCRFNEYSFYLWGDGFNDTQVADAAVAHLPDTQTEYLFEVFSVSAKHLYDYSPFDIMLFEQPVQVIVILLQLVCI